MKKILFCFVLLFPIIALSQDKWIAIAINSSGDTIKVSKQRISWENDVVKVWIKTVYSEEGKKPITEAYFNYHSATEEEVRKWKNLAYDLSHNEYDCKNNKFKKGYSAYYDRNGITLTTDAGSNVWHDIPPQSSAESVLIVIRKTKK